MNSVCAPKMLDYLVETKEYRILSCALWRSVQSNTELSIESRFLWTVLWELCAPDKNYEKTLTWSFLSNRVGKSESTIRRWARQLQKKGFLEIKFRFREDGSQAPCIFRIGVPDSVARMAAITFPDRKRKEESVSKNDILQQEILEASGAGKESGDQSPNPAQHAEKESAITKSGASIAQSAPDCSLAERLKRIQERAAASRTSVQGVSHTQTAVSTERRLEALTDSSAKTPKKGSNRAGEGAFRPGMTPGSKSASQGINRFNQDNNNNPAPREGLRMVIQRELEQRMTWVEDVSRYVEEFAISIEKGTFRTYPFKKAINVGIKLVREGRWTTPRYAV